VAAVHFNSTVVLTGCWLVGRSSGSCAAEMSNWMLRAIPGLRPPEAHCLLQRLEFHYTPKHASWLNMVEIEIGVLCGQLPQSPDRRTTDADHRDRQNWRRLCNAARARIKKGMFATARARNKLARPYSCPANES